MYMYNEILQQPEVLRRCHKANIGIIEQIVDTVESSDINNIVIAARGTIQR